MKVYEGKDIRNLVVIGHSHSGKTSLVSAMFYTGGPRPSWAEWTMVQRLQTTTKKKFRAR